MANMTGFGEMGNEAQSAGPRLAPQGLRWAGLMAPPTYCGGAGWLCPPGVGLDAFHLWAGLGSKGAHA